MVLTDTFFSSTCIRCSLQADCHRGVACRGRSPSHPHHCPHFYMLQVRSCYTQAPLDWSPFCTRTQRASRSSQHWVVDTTRAGPSLLVALSKPPSSNLCKSGCKWGSGVGLGVLPQNILNLLDVISCILVYLEDGQMEMGSTLTRSDS